MKRWATTSMVVLVLSVIVVFVMLLLTWDFIVVNLVKSGSVEMKPRSIQ